MLTPKEEKEELKHLKRDGLLLEHCEEQTLEMCRVAIQQNYHALAYVLNPTEELQQFAIKESSWAIQYIENPTEDLSLLAVNANGNVLELIKNPTNEVYLAAIQNNPTVIQSIPLNKVTEEMCWTAIKSAHSYKYLDKPHSILSYIPHSFLTPAFMEKAIEQYGTLIASIPAEKQSDSLQQLAVNSDPYSILSIKNPSQDLIIQAVKQKPRLIRSLPNPSELVLCLALEQDGMLIEDIPVKHRTPELCLTAVAQNGFALEYIKQQSQKLCETAVAQNGLALKFVKKQTKKIQELAMTQNGLALEFVENPSDSLMQLAISNNPVAIRYIPHPTEALALTALSRNPKTIYWIAAPSETLIRQALQLDGLCLEYIRPHYLTLDLCWLAFEQNPLTLQFIKEPFISSMAEELWQLKFGERGSHSPIANV